MLKNRSYQFNQNLPSCPICPAPLIKFPTLPKQEFRYVFPKQVQLFEYYTISDGNKRIFTDKDALEEYGKQYILDPKYYSYSNLFINGVLQPSANYNVKKGELIINTEDLPLKKSPITLQMVKVKK